jgi:hypothetical protein
MGNLSLIIPWSSLIKHKDGDEETRRIAKFIDENHSISGKVTGCWCSPNAALRVANAALCEVQDVSGDRSNAWKASNDTLCYNNDIRFASNSHSTSPATLSQRRPNCDGRCTQPGASQAICNTRLTGATLESLAGEMVQAIRYCSIEGHCCGHCWGSVWRIVFGA